MVTNATFLTALIAIAAMSVSMMGLVTKLLSDRIGDLAGGVDHLEARIDRRFVAVEGAITDIAKRLPPNDSHFG